LLSPLKKTSYKTKNPLFLQMTLSALCSLALLLLKLQEKLFKTYRWCCSRQKGV